tara:strand:+ start:220 stop:783 length:564 start_codon:yes stop_codon:yes gene_type:complete
MSKKLSKEILKYSVFAGFIFSLMLSVPLLIDKGSMDIIWEDPTCADIDEDGLYNFEDPDIDGDGIDNDDDSDMDGDGLLNEEDSMIFDCKGNLNYGHFYALFLFIIGPIISAFIYRKKVPKLIYRECFSICFLTLAVGTITGQLIMAFIYKSSNIIFSDLLITLQTGAMGLVLCAAYSFLLALFLKK